MAQSKKTRFSRSRVETRTRKHTRVSTRAAWVPRGNELKLRLIRGALWIALVGTFALVAYGAMWLSWLPALNATEITVEGNSVVRTHAVETIVYAATEQPVAYVFSPKSVVWYPREELQAAVLDAFPMVDTVDIATPFFKKSVVVSLHERDTYVVWCKSELACYRVDPQGIVFEALTTGEALMLGADSLVISGGPLVEVDNPLRLSVSEEYFGVLIHMVRELEAVGVHITSCTLESSDARCTVGLSQSQWKFVAALDKDINVMLHNLKAFLHKEHILESEENIEYIDMRFDDRVYYKEKGDTVAQ